MGVELPTNNKLKSNTKTTTKPSEQHDHVQGHSTHPQHHTEVVVKLKANQQVKVETVSYSQRPSFIMVASGYQRAGLNYTKELLEMNSSESFLFGTLMDNRIVPDPTKPMLKSNKAILSNKLLNKAEQKKVYEGYKKLARKRLVIRIKRGLYLINPEFLIPADSLFESELIEFIQLTNKG